MLRVTQKKKKKKLPQLTSDPFLVDEGLYPSMTGYKAAVTFLSLLQHDTVAVCVSRANTELSVDSGSGRITTLLNSPTTQPPPPLDLEKDADSQTANIGHAERSGVTRMGCCSLTGYS